MRASRPPNGRERIYGPGYIRSRTATCPKCHIKFKYYGQAASRKLCNSCHHKQTMQQLWATAWRKFGEAISE